MKNYLLLLVALATFSFANAQNADRQWSIGIEGGGQQYQGDYGNGFYRPEHGLYGFGGFSVYKYLSAHLDLGVQFSTGTIGYKNNDITAFSNKMYQINGNLRYNFLKEGTILRPFVLVGIGDFYLSDKNSLNVHDADIMTFPDLAAGVNIRLNAAFTIKLQETLLLPFRTFNNGEKQDAYLLHTIGLSYNIGHKIDADGDGVADSKDKCPNTPKGVAVDGNGCPLDTDGDGIPDYQDECPTEKGTIAAKGCPDSDGDGVADKDDKCPGTPAGVAVDATGCPLDRDKDGIADYMDDCPDQKGLPEFKGCPDTDGDGVPDKNDKCPKTPAGVKVDVNGCPLDRDGDGVPDYMDACPDVPGTKENKGCPEVKNEVKELFKKALEGIEFETGKDVIHKNSYSILNQVVTALKDNPSYNLQINGHTDDKGN